MPVFSSEQDTHEELSRAHGKASRGQIHPGTVPLVQGFCARVQP